MNSWQPFFPFEKWRASQAEGLDFLVGNLGLADDLFLNAPTGIGKSAITIALARYLAAYREASYISSITIALENQYMRDFSKLGLRQLHSKGHYPCPSRSWRTSPLYRRSLLLQDSKSKVLRGRFFYRQQFLHLHVCPSCAPTGHREMSPFSMRRILFTTRSAAVIHSISRIPKWNSFLPRIGNLLAENGLFFLARHSDS
jgi:hypothetical protein